MVAELVIDRFVPRYDIALTHAAVFRAPPEVSLKAMRQIDLFRHPAFRLLFVARSLPARLAGRRGEPLRTFRIDDLIGTDFGWVLLGEQPGTEVVIGQIAQPWQVTAPESPAVVPAGFAAFDRPGFAKIVLSLRADPRGAGSSVLTVETRVAFTDHASRRRFRRYWLVIRPLSELLRGVALRMLARELNRPRIEGDIVIERPVDEVFDAVADERNEPRYNPDMLLTEKVTDGPVGEGTRFRSLHRGLRRPVEVNNEITTCERPVRLAIRSTMDWADVEGTLSFEAVPTGTRMCWSWDVRPKGAYRVLAPFLPRLTKREEQGVWAGLKHLLENRGAARA